MPMLSKLKDCTNITTLLLAETSAITDLENLHNDVFVEMVSWLTSCKNLRNVTFTSLLSGPALITPILLAPDIRLTHLKLEGYTMKGNRDFHQALAHQTSLRSLSLKGEAEESFGGRAAEDETEILERSICQLVNVVELDLKEISDYFVDYNICQLAKSLPKLKVWWTSGLSLSDHIWSDVASLESLQRLELSASTNFTKEGILHFISRLGRGNQGFVLTIMMAEMDSDLSEDEQSEIRRKMTEQVDGRFDFTLMRGKDWRLRNRILMDANIYARSRGNRLFGRVRLMAQHYAAEWFLVPCRKPTGPTVSRALFNSPHRYHQKPYDVSVSL